MYVCTPCRYDIYDINPDCPRADLARFNNTELTELRLVFAAAEHYVTKKREYVVRPHSLVELGRRVWCGVAWCCRSRVGASLASIQPSVDTGTHTHTP